jgi:hypothetical protein
MPASAQLRRSPVLLLAALTLGAVPVAAQWRAEAWFGDAWNARAPITFRQDGQAEIKLTPNWSTRPWRPTWYYSGRIAKWSGERGWAFHYMHHKLYLDNPPAEITAFRITNGVNMLLAERLWRKNGWEFALGAGPTLIVPFSTIRGKTYGRVEGIFGSRYDLGAASIEAGVARRLKLLPYTYGSLTAAVTVTSISAKIADGRATTMNYALHLQYGLSLQSAK